MSHEKIEVTVKRPWLFRLLLVLFGAVAGAGGNQAMQPTVQVTERVQERVVFPPRDCPKPPPVHVVWPDRLQLNINGVPAAVAVPK